ncbi:Uma2 family endonuclease [Streptomyces sp. NEAU-W12]|uniref:Uma2 family endonuclease n=1 Tax=Streptomyces sp. NEAU-W12 TaxID=2994668 RepID=UPI00224A8409|nr:Uma2 family endonuclease [Streptomyces sp. NEAU-W12]MCX2927359.1 Uma2 family endonuclease [Streptomyces sp. NEAU-W12]
MIRWTGAEGVRRRAIACRAATGAGPGRLWSGEKAVVRAPASHDAGRRCAAASVMSELIERDAIPEGYKVEVFAGRVIMTPRSPEQDWTVSDVKDAVKASGIARKRVFGDVLITFPGENDAAPDLTIVDFDAERRKTSYSCLDVLAAVAVPSESEGEKDYVRNVQKYGRFGIDFYMIADPFETTVTLMSEPHAVGYARVVEIPYGEPVSFTPAAGERVEIGTGAFPTCEAGGA